MQMQMLTQTSPTSNPTGFWCTGPGCGQWISDVRYVGPRGHAPGNLCFECWMAQWEKIEARAANAGAWTRLDEALWLLCHGVSFDEAAGAIGSCRSALRLRIERMRWRPELTPGWLPDIHRVCRDKQNLQEILR
jgi:hypothetical protein